MDAWRRVGLFAVAAIAVAACGGDSGGDGGGGDPQASALPKTASVKSGDERVAHPLQAGRYRLSWSATDCDEFHIVITGADGNAIYDNDSPSIRIIFVNDVPAGEYFIEQAAESCQEWSIDMTKV